MAAGEPMQWRGSAVTALLRTFSWAELRHHGLRHAAAVLAVMLGVALAFSVHLINQSALSEFSAAVRVASGQADLSLKAAQGGLDEQWYARVARREEVARASPVVELATRAQGADGRFHPLRVIGLDPLVAGPLTPALVPQLATGHDRLDLFAPDVISLNATAQRLLGVSTGQVLAVQSGLSLVRLRVVGTVAAPGEPMGVMDIAGAQTAFGRLGQISRVDVQLAPGAQRQALIAALALPPGVVAESAADDTARVGDVSQAYRVNLTVLALVALFTGGFLVFSILSLSVAKRLQQLALLGVLGLSAAERLRLVLWESALLGLSGSLLGIALGTALAQAALQLLGGDLGGGYFPGIAPRLQWSGAAALLYGGLGVAAAMAGGWFPARMAQRLAPAQALKGLGGVSVSRPGWRRWVGVALLLMGVGLSRLPPVGGVPLAAYLAVACLLLGGIACVPALVGLLLGVWPQPRRATGLLAMERARRMRHTATVAIAGVVASLSLSVALTVMVSSFRGSVVAWLDVILPADLYARAAQTGNADEMRLDGALLTKAARLPGVRRAAGQRVTALTLAPGRPAVALLARRLDLGAEGQGPRGLPLVGALAPGHPGRPDLFVSEAVVDLYGVTPGQALALPLRPGQPAVVGQVRGVWRDYARQQGAIVMDAEDYQRATGDTALNDLALWLEPGVRTADVQAGVREAARAQGLDGDLLEFAEPREIRQTTLRIFDRSFAVTYWLQAVAIAIGLFGTAASFSAQVLARRKEFGLLSHLGFTRGQVLSAVAGEGAALTAVGAVLGLLLGLAVSVVLVRVVNPQSFHWTMELLVPWGRVALLCAGVVLAGTATALLAGRAAVSRDAVMAVKEDW